MSNEIQIMSVDRMTPIDEFAKEAMKFFCRDTFCDFEEVQYPDEKIDEIVSFKCYRLAEAMMNERAKRMAPVDVFQDIPNVTLDHIKNPLNYVDATEMDLSQYVVHFPSFKKCDFPKVFATPSGHYGMLHLAKTFPDPKSAALFAQTFSTEPFTVMTVLEARKLHAGETRGAK
jgi:hypothetical protein